MIVEAAAQEILRKWHIPHQKYSSLNACGYFL